MRVKVENQEKKSFEEGIFHFQEYLMHFLSKIDSNEMKNGILRDETDIFDEKAKNEFSRENYSPPMKQKIETINSNILRKGNLTNDYPNQRMDLSREIRSRYFPSTNLLEDSFSNPFQKNQICIELCNIQRCNSLSLKEKMKKCSQRKNFCQKMLQNENFIALMENIMKQKHEVERIHLISELRNHLSNQQLFCLFAHLSYIKQLDFSDLEIINLIQALFKLNLDTQLDNNMDQSSVFPPISRNKNNEHFSSSVTSN